MKPSLSEELILHGLEVSEQMRSKLDTWEVPETLIPLFEGASEAQRKEVSSFVFECARRERNDGYSQAVSCVALATCSLGQIKKLGQYALPLRTHYTVRILADRRPKWIDAWAEWTISLGRMERYITDNWAVVRVLSRMGVCEMPDKPETTTSIVGGVWDAFLLRQTLANRRYPTAEERRAPGGKLLLRCLRDDPDLLKNDIWGLFEIPGPMAMNLAGRDPYWGWSEAMVELARDGTMPRQRMLDSILHALQSDFPEKQATWFRRLHDALEPSSEERAQRAQCYLRLLDSSIPPIVSFATTSVASLVADGTLEGKEVIPRLGSALSGRTKTAAMKALAVLDRVSRRNQKIARQAAEAACQGLAHGAEEVQSRAAGLIRKYGDPSDPSLRDRVTSLVDGTTAVVRPSLLDWLGESSPVAEASSEAIDLPDFDKRIAALDAKYVEVCGIAKVRSGISDHPTNDLESIEFDGTEVPRLDPDKEIVPIATLDELIEVCAAAIEGALDPEEIERALDGVARLRLLRPADFAKRTAPLLKRVSGTNATGPQIALLRQALAHWLGHNRDSDVVEGDEHLRPARLCTPTHRGYWIDPRILVQRAIRWNDQADEVVLLDQVYSLLRLAPDRRNEALPAAARVDGEYGCALRYAFGASQEIGPTAPLWVAAARARAPWSDDFHVDRAHSGLGPDGALAARYRWWADATKFLDHYDDPETSYALRIEVQPRVPAAEDDSESYRPESISENFPTVLEHRRWSLGHLDMYESPSDEGPLYPGVWPLARESWFARGAQRLSNNARYGHISNDEIYIEPLLDADVPLLPMAELTLVFGLCAKATDQHTLAVDALTACIEDGRVTGPELGDCVARLVESPLLMTNRLAKNLSIVASASALHAFVVRRLIESALQPQTSAAKKQWLPLLPLLRELLVDQHEAVTSVAARALLQDIAGKGKVGESAKALLALTPVLNPSRTRRVLQQALIGRLERAERWTRFSAQ